MRRSTFSNTIARGPLIILLALLLAGCSHSGRVYEGTLDFPSGKWLRFEPRELKAQIPNAEDCYELHVSALIDTTLYRESSLPLTIKITSQQGETRTIFASLSLRSNDGHSLGEPAPDGAPGALHFGQRIREYFYFNTSGAHTISIGQRTSRYEIQGIRQVCFSVSKANIELPK